MKNLILIITALVGADAMYRKKGTGNPVWRYVVSGTVEAIAYYKSELKKQDINCHETEDGKVLFFTPRYAGAKGTLYQTQDGRFQVDMSKLEGAKSLTEQMGGNFGDVIGQALVGDALGIAPIVNPTAQIEEASAEEVEDSKDEGEGEAIDQH